MIYITFDMKKELPIYPYQNYNSKYFKSTLKSINLIAKKHNLNPKLLLETFSKALKNTISRCGSLKILCRVVDQDSATFLITNEGKIISQFSIRLDLLLVNRIEIPVPTPIIID